MHLLICTYIATQAMTVPEHGTLFGLITALRGRGGQQRGALQLSISILMMIVYTILH